MDPYELLVSVLASAELVRQARHAQRDGRVARQLELAWGSVVA